MKYRSPESVLLQIRELTTGADRRDAVPILRQLWSSKEPKNVFEWNGTDDHYLFGGFVDGDLLAVAGVPERELLHHEPHACLYDLVVDEPQRGNGNGSELLDYVEQWTAERSCASIALASPLAKTDVHQYYEGQVYETWGYVIEKIL